MYLYALTVQQATAICQGVFGSFSQPKAQEIVVSRGKILELIRLVDGKLQTIVSTEIFGCIRSLASFRLTGANLDYIVVGSDSGRITILEFKNTTQRFEKVHQETFGKSGCRRLVPGEYLAPDPRGRALMIAGIEKQKFVYILNRDSANHLTISSPLEAHKGHNILLSVCGVDVGFDNPIFACLEMDYNEAEEELEARPPKQLTYYELDLGLNHMVRKWTDSVHPKANMLISVPGGNDGPSGVLVCSEDFIQYKKQGHEDIEPARIPRRETALSSRGLIIVSHATLKPKTGFFFLLQSEEGDLYKVSLKYDGEVVKKINIAFFDTVPVANSLSFLRAGFLFVACETGDHRLYQFQGIGDDSEDLAFSKEGDDHLYFRPRPLKNLLLVDTISNLAPMCDFQVHELFGEDSPQMYALCGRGRHSNLRIMRHGLEATEMAVSPLPGNPNAVWTVRKSLGDEFDKYIVVSFVNATLVLSIGETVEEVADADSGFLGSVPTLATHLIGEDSIVQVHPNGIRHIRTNKRIHEWKAPGKKTIVHAAVNNRQVIIALSGGELYYFELDASGSLMEAGRKELGHDVACLDVGPVPHGRTRSRFLAVGDWDQTVRVLSLDPVDVMSQIAVQQLPAQPESVCILEMRASENATPTLFLNVGLTDGVLLRTVLDAITGELSDTRRRFLGAGAVKLFRVTVAEQTAMLALCSRPWLSFSYANRFFLTPITYSKLHHATNFASEQCPEGIVAIAENTLRIITTENLGASFNETRIPLRYTPRKMIVHPDTKMLVIYESDHGAVPLDQLPSKMELEKPKTEDEDEDEDEESAEYEVEVKAPAGQWRSCIRLLDPVSRETKDLIELDNNECAVSICTCVFHGRNGEVYVVIGTAHNMTFQPRSSQGGFIHVYRVDAAQSKLVLLHKTEVDGIPGALCPFQGRILVGVGAALRIYDIGKKKLLRKCESSEIPTFVREIHTQGDRIIVGDVAESFHYLKYKKGENQMYLFADDTNPRWVTASTMLDYDTVAGGDKFGNVFVCRLASEISEDIEDDPTGAKLKLQQKQFGGAPNKVDECVQFHVGEVVTSLQRTSLVTAGSQALVYGTIVGGIGVLLPLVSREDVDFFSHLEMHLRQANPPLCGRDHLQYRSYYFPVRDVMDGDLCETFSLLDPAKQRAIADELDRTPGEVMKKLEDIRNMCI